MGTLIGAWLGAVGIMIVGRSFKNRDFMALAIIMFLIALLLGLLAWPFILAVEPQLIADGVIAADETWKVNVFVGASAFFITFMPAMLFVAFAEPGPR